MRLNSVPLLLYPLVEQVKALKEDLVRSQPTKNEVAPIATWERQMHTIAVGMAPKVDRDAGLEMAGVGIAGFAADACCFAFEGYMAHTTLDPSTGNPWEPHAMGRLVHEYPDLAASTVFEAFMFLRLTRVDRPMLMTTLPFAVKDGTVEWRPAADGLGGAAFSGVVNDYLKNMMMRPSTIDEMIEKLGPPPEGVDPFPITDRVTKKLLRSLGVHLLSE